MVNPPLLDKFVITVDSQGVHSIIEHDPNCSPHLELIVGFDPRLAELLLQFMNLLVTEVKWR